MDKKITSSEFKTLVNRYYQFLIDDFDFSIDKSDDWSFNLKAKNTRVFLLVEHAILLTVALEPIEQEARKLLRQNILPRGIEVAVVSMCLDPELRYKAKRINNSIAHDIPFEMERRAELLKKYCTKMLTGDFSDWPSIEKCMSIRAYEYLNI
jgi:hypothetical protein